MQTPFFTDCIATATRTVTDERVDATVTLKFIDQDGRHAGTSIAGPTELNRLGVQLIQLAADTALHAVSPDLYAAPERVHLILTRDLRVTEAA